MSVCYSSSARYSSLKLRRNAHVAGGVIYLPFMGSISERISTPNERQHFGADVAVAISLFQTSN